MVGCQAPRKIDHFRQDGVLKWRYSPFPSDARTQDPTRPDAADLGDARVFSDWNLEYPYGSGGWWYRSDQVSEWQEWRD